MLIRCVPADFGTLVTPVDVYQYCNITSQTHKTRLITRESHCCDLRSSFPPLHPLPPSFPPSEIFLCEDSYRTSPMRTGLLLPRGISIPLPGRHVRLIRRPLLTGVLRAMPGGVRLSRRVGGGTRPEMRWAPVVLPRGLGVSKGSRRWKLYHRGVAGHADRPGCPVMMTIVMIQ